MLFQQGIREVRVAPDNSHVVLKHILECYLPISLKYFLEVSLAHEAVGLRRVAGPARSYHVPDRGIEEVIIGDEVIGLGRVSEIPTTVEALVILIGI